MPTMSARTIISKILSEFVPLEATRGFFSNDILNGTYLATVHSVTSDYNCNMPHFADRPN